MDLQEILDELKSLANNQALSLELEDEPGYRHGYYDALVYVIDILEEYHELF